MPSEIEMALIKGKRTAMRHRIRMRLRSLFRMMFPIAANRKLRCRIILLFQKELINRYFLKVGDRCRSIWAIGISTRNRPECRIIHRLDPRVKIDEVPDGSADGPHSNSSYHPLKGNHLIRMDPFPGILIQSDR
jgi:hypothetical protein